MIRCFVAALAACSLFVSSASAGSFRFQSSYAHSSVVTNGIVVPQGFVVTQFAVPVAVPVAPMSYVFYRSGGCMVQAPAMQLQPGAAQPQPVPEVGGDKPQPTTGAQPNPQPQPVPASDPNPQPEPVKSQSASLVKEYCGNCHGTTNPKGNLVLDGVNKLDADHFRSAIGRLLSDDPELRMPKGAVVSPEKLGLLMQELEKLK